MIKERAIFLIRSRCPQNPRKPWGVEYKNACEMAIKALEQEPCGDAINREETLTAFADYAGSGMSMNDYDALWDIVVKMPPVTPQPKIGHWIDDNDGHGTSCSKCGKWYPHSYLTKQDIIYCCKCGAKMEVEE